jgi:predicted Zn-dependent peptidase
LALAPTLALLLFLPAAPPAAPAKDVPDIQFEKYTLPNGLQVILHVDRKLPIVHVNQWFHVGSRTRSPAAPASPTSSST